MVYTLRTVRTGDSAFQNPVDRSEITRLALEAEKLASEKFHLQLTSVAKTYELEVAQAALDQIRNPPLAMLNISDWSIRYASKRTGDFLASVYETTASLPSLVGRSLQDAGLSPMLVGSRLPPRPGAASGSAGGLSIARVGRVTSPNHEPLSVASGGNPLQKLNEHLERLQRLEAFEKNHFNRRLLDGEEVFALIRIFQPPIDLDPMAFRCADGRLNRYERAHLVVALFNAAYAYGEKLASEGKSPEALVEKFASAKKDFKGVLDDQDQIIEMMICNKVSEMQRRRRIGAFAHSCIQSGWESKKREGIAKPVAVKSPTALQREGKKRTTKATNARMANCPTAEVRRKFEDLRDNRQKSSGPEIIARLAQIHGLGKPQIRKIRREVNESAPVQR